MILIVYRTVLRGPEMQEAHDEMTRITDIVAESAPGYLGAERFHPTPLETVGLMRFENEEAVKAWSDHPDHQLAHVRGVEELYEMYSVEVYEFLRQSGFQLDAAS